MFDSLFQSSASAQTTDQAAEPVNLATAKAGSRYHVTSLGKTRTARLEVLTAGLAPDAVIDVLRSSGTRPRIVACGEIRAAIGEDLARGVKLLQCGCGCGCNNERDNT
ncbi:ferrous iron transport protein A [Roseibium sp. SCP14]|uniref:ferrous iron transport protein A n=1 Tax=Roseibium sp. SCP14 TaxID=3141375 RepID=UPI00333BBB6A